MSAVEEANVTNEQTDILGEQPIASETNATEDLDPEKDGLDKGQATADVHGDILGI